MTPACAALATPAKVTVASQSRQGFLVPLRSGDVQGVLGRSVAIWDWMRLPLRLIVRRDGEARRVRKQAPGREESGGGGG